MIASLLPTPACPLPSSPPVPFPPSDNRRRELRHLTDGRPVTAAERAVLYDPHRGRYWNVFHPFPRSRRWRCRVAKNLNISGIFDSEKDAADRLVRWLRAWYGREWVGAYRQMRANRGRTRCGGRRGVFRAEVFVRGRAVVVGEGFASLPAARRAVRAWLAAYRAENGAFWRLTLWRG